MPSDSKFTRDNDGNVAVRVVSNTGVSEQPESMFTTDEDGNVAVRVVFGEGGGGGGGSDQHNLGWYATQAALEEAHPTAEAGDWAIVGATDTVWIWDTDNSEWVDSDKKGQVTSVNGQTGAVTITGDDVLPSQTNNSGKFLTTNGTTASWGTTINGAYKSVITLSPYTEIFNATDSSNKSKFAIYYSSTAYTGGIVFRDSDANYKSGLAFYNTSSVKTINPIGTGWELGVSNNKWKNIYVEKLNNGADITVPAVAGEMAVKQVNTTITLTAADWSSNTQTVNVTGMTADGVVMVSPDPIDQSAYTSNGVLCTAQAAGTLTFACDTVPSGDLSVNVVML